MYYFVQYFERHYLSSSGCYNLHANHNGNDDTDDDNDDDNNDIENLTMIALRDQLNKHVFSVTLVKVPLN